MHDAPSPDRAVSQRVVALLAVGDEPHRWVAAISSLVAAGAEVRALMAPGAALPDELALPGVTTSTRTLHEETGAAVDDGADALVIAHQPAVVPPEAFAPALAIAAADPRTATVSFFANIANYLSFPRRNAPSAMVPPGQDERSLTALLRATQGSQHGPFEHRAVPVPVPAGVLVLVTRRAFVALGGLAADIDQPEPAVLELALRAAARGLRNVLDTSTYLVVPLPPPPRIDAVADEAWRDRLGRVHAGFPALYDAERDDPHGVVADAIALARVQVFGLDVAVDASCLGPHEMGTQVALLSQVAALAEHSGVHSIYVGTPLGTVPDYASSVLDHAKITVGDVEGGGFPDVHEVDVLHRPFQPDSFVPIARWRSIARRSVVTVQDLVAYENGDYFELGRDWLSYRWSLAASVGSVDAVIAISQDTRAAMERARLPVESSRLSVVLNGTDHLVPGLRAESSRGAVAQLGDRPFLLVLGASYEHKNRDIAIRAWHELRAAGYPHELVLAGMVVPFGRARDAEALAALGGEAPTALPDVSTAERDWLLGNADVVVYPTSAEGFGLVPFEAAIWGTPTAFVSFGPLAETLRDVPVTAAGWGPHELADAVRRLLDEPDLARAQVAAVARAGETLTWSRYADELVGVYLRALASPRKVDALAFQLAITRQRVAEVEEELERVRDNSERDHQELEAIRGTLAYRVLRGVARRTGRT